MCYYIIPFNITQAVAKSACVALNAMLTYITSKEENDFIQQHVIRFVMFLTNMEDL